MWFRLGDQRPLSVLEARNEEASSAEIQEKSFTSRGTNKRKVPEVEASLVR